MCGLFGFISNDSTLKELRDNRLFDQIARANFPRGSRAFGHIHLGTDFEEIKRVDREMNDMDIPDLYLNTHALLAHCKTPTSDQPRSDVSYIHPISNGRFALAHNGIVQDWEAHRFVRPRNMRNVEMDTTVILGYIQYFIDNNNDVFDAIVRTMQSLEGQIACWLLDRKNERIYIWRQMSPIYIYETRAGVFFSSARCRQREFHTPLAEGEIRSWSYNAGYWALEDCGFFEPKSIYRRA